jgi:hypothetical protein
VLLPGTRMNQTKGVGCSMVGDGKEFVVILLLLLDDTEIKMGNVGCINYPCAFKLNRCAAEIVKQANSFTKEDGYKMDMDFIQQAELKALLCNIRSGDSYIFTISRRFGLCNRTLDAIRDKDKGRVCSGPLFGNRVGNNKARNAHRVLTAPSLGIIKGSASCYVCAELKRLTNEFGAYWVGSEG